MGSEMTHLVELAEKIGPRPAAGDGEARAGDYIARMLEARGLPVERQGFRTPRTYSWAYVLYHVLTISAAVASFWFAWPALAVAACTAVLMRSDLDTRFGLTSLLPKSPSANIIARHVPRTGRNERAQRVVIVAHYDSAKSSLAFSPGMVKSFAATFGLMRWCTYLTPVAILAGIVLAALPWTKGWGTWTWYATLAVSAYLVIPLLINVHRELLMKHTDGANDNASGVAVLLGLAERIVPEPEVAAARTGSMPRVQRTEEDAWTAGVVPDGAAISYTQAKTAPVSSWLEEDAEDIGWGDGGQSSMRLDAAAEPSRSVADAASFTAAAPAGATDSWGSLDDDDAEPPVAAPRAAVREPVPAAAPPAASAPEPTREPLPAPAPDHRAAMPFNGAEDDEYLADLFTAPAKPMPDMVTPTALPAERPDVAAPPAAPAPAPGPAEPPAGEAPEERPGRSRGSRSLFGFGKREESAPRRTERHGVRDWLGVGNDFDARKEGSTIGSWDNFKDEEEENDDGFGSKGGAASVDDPAAADYPASEAARIRRKVTFDVERELLEKEVWFVATGAEEVGTVGMKAFLREYGRELKGALIINLDNLGTGALSYVTSEGMGKRYQSDRRLVGAAKRFARETESPVRGTDYRGLSTDATPALARGFRAMSVMAFDINGRLPNWHWSSDTVENIDEGNLTKAVDLVAGIIKSL